MRKPTVVTEKRWAWVFDGRLIYLCQRGYTKRQALGLFLSPGEHLVRITLSYTLPKEKGTGE